MKNLPSLFINRKHGWWWSGANEKKGYGEAPKRKEPSLKEKRKTYEGKENDFHVIFMSFSGIYLHNT